MGYNSSKGPQQMGDIQFESDPDDVQIDFAADYIALKTNGSKRLIVDAATITSSVTHYFWNDIPIWCVGSTQKDEGPGEFLVVNIKSEKMIVGIKEINRWKSFYIIEFQRFTFPNQHTSTRNISEA